MCKRMNEKDLEEAFALLQRAGMDPRLCDTPVPFSEQSVKAGIPSMPGDPSRDEYIMLPKELVGRCPMFFVDVDGDSMVDAGIMPGDRLRVQICDTAEDGDVVIASVDGECTVKAFLRDESGTRWLVPRNDKYEPIELREDMNVRILGRVLEHIRQTPRISHSDLMHSIRQKKQNVTHIPSGEEARTMRIIAAVAPMVKCKRQWYAVFHPLVDCGMLGENMYGSFVEMVRRSVPQHAFLPTMDGLQRMAVQSFRLPVTRWDAKKAPVTGKRFEEYVGIAKAVMKAARV